MSLHPKTARDLSSLQKTATDLDRADYPEGKVEAFRTYYMALMPLVLETPTAKAYSDILVTPPSSNNPTGSRFSDSRWEWPASWVNSNTSSQRVIEFKIRILNGYLTDPDHADLLTSIKRYLLAQMITPIGNYRDISSIKRQAYYLIIAARWIIANGYPRGIRLFRDMTLRELGSMTSHISRNWREGSGSFTAWRRMLLQINEHGALGNIEDYFWQVPLNLLGGAESAEGEFELDGGAEDDDTPTERPVTSDDDEHAWQPLPDTYLDEMGLIALSYIENLAPHIIRHLRQWHRISRDAAAVGRKRAWGDRSEISARQVKHRKIQAYRAYAKNYNWLDRKGQPIRIKFETNYAFPPTTFVELQVLVSTLQTCCYQLLALCTAGRWSDLKMLPTWSVQYVEDRDTAGEIVTGRTYKISPFYSGEEREWAVPAEVRRAVKVMELLFRPYRPAGDQVLWRKTGTNDFGTPMSDMIDYHLKTFVKRHGLEKHFSSEKAEFCEEGNVGGGDPIHSHRFRKSIVRLVVLCLTGAPRILQNLLGHKDIATTIDYILSSPWVREELKNALEIQEEMLLTRLVKEVDSAGGGGADRVRRSRDHFFALCEVPETLSEQTQRVRDYIEVLMADGDHQVRMIFEGIICVKPIGAAGRCTRSGKLPNVARCDVKCPWHVQLPSRRTDVEDTVRFLLSELQDPEVQDNLLMLDYTFRELLDQLAIFDDVREAFQEEPSFADLVKASAIRLEQLRRLPI